MNTRYAKIKEDGALEYAPSVLDGFYNPSASRCLAHGYLPVVQYQLPSTHRAGYHWEQGPWQSVDGEITRLWTEVKNPPPQPRTFSKYRLVRALQAENVWDEVKTWLQSQEGAWDLYLAAEDISEDEPLLAQGIAAVKQLLGWTDEQVAAVLDAAAIGGA